MSPKKVIFADFEGLEGLFHRSPGQRPGIRFGRKRALQGHLKSLPWNKIEEHFQRSDTRPASTPDDVLGYGENAPSGA